MPLEQMEFDFAPRPVKKLGTFVDAEAKPKMITRVTETEPSIKEAAEILVVSDGAGVPRSSSVN